MTDTTSAPVLTGPMDIDATGMRAVVSESKPCPAPVPFPLVPWRASGDGVVVHAPSVDPLNEQSHPYLDSASCNEVQQSTQE